MKIIYSLLILAMTPFLTAEETSNYVKAGVAFPPMPTVGIGTRIHHERTAIDLSANFDSLIAFNYGELKGLYLYYPRPDEENPLYYGVGTGIAYRINLIEAKGIYRSQNTSQGIIPIDFVVGREYREEGCMQTFLQFELSQPVIRFARDYGKGSYVPRAAVTYGWGF